MALVSSVAHRLTSTKSHRHGLCQRKYVLCCVRFCNSMNNRMTRFMILQLWVLFIFQIRISSIQANPDKVGCTLIGESGSNVMTRTTVMGATPNDVSNLISFSSNTYSSGGQQITVTISNLKTGGAVIHSDKGSLTKPSPFTDKGCTGADTLYYKESLSSTSYTLTLTVPSDIFEPHAQ